MSSENRAEAGVKKRAPKRKLKLTQKQSRAVDFYLTSFDAEHPYGDLDGSIQKAYGLTGKWRRQRRWVIRKSMLRYPPFFKLFKAVEGCNFDLVPEPLKRQLFETIDRVVRVAEREGDKIITQWLSPEKVNPKEREMLLKAFRERYIKQHNQKKHRINKSKRRK